LEPVNNFFSPASKQGWPKAKRHALCLSYDRACPFGFKNAAAYMEVLPDEIS
jgi:hypothetical protein